MCNLKKGTLRSLKIIEGAHAPLPPLLSSLPLQFRRPWLGCLGYSAASLIISCKKTEKGITLKQKFFKVYIFLERKVKKILREES